MANVSTALLVALAAVVIIIIGAGLYLVYQPAPNVSTIATTVPSTTTQNTTTTSISQGLSGCPNINYMITNNVTGSSGFETYNVSGYRDRVIPQGGTATLNYTATVTSLAGQSPNILNKTQIVDWANGVQYPISNGAIGTAVNSLVSGITISFVISTQNITNTTTEYKMSATMFARSGAPNETYYVTLGPGLPLCGAEMSLVTVGAHPYNGTFSLGVAA